MIENLAESGAATSRKWGKRAANRTAPFDSLALLAEDMLAWVAYVRRVDQRMPLTGMVMVYMTEAFALRAQLMAGPSFRSAPVQNEAYTGPVSESVGPHDR